MGKYTKMTKTEAWKIGNFWKPDWVKELEEQGDLTPHEAFIGTNLEESLESLLVFYNGKREFYPAEGYLCKDEENNVIYHVDTETFERDHVSNSGDDAPSIGVMVVDFYHTGPSDGATIKIKDIVYPDKGYVYSELIAYPTFNQSAKHIRKLFNDSGCVQIKINSLGICGLALIDLLETDLEVDEYIYKALRNRNDEGPITTLIRNRFLNDDVEPVESKV